MSSTISLTTPDLPIDNLEDFLEEVRKLFDQHRLSLGSDSDPR